MVCLRPFVAARKRRIAPAHGRSYVAGFAVLEMVVLEGRGDAIAHSAGLWMMMMMMMRSEDSHKYCKSACCGTFPHSSSIGIPYRDVIVDRFRLGVLRISLTLFSTMGHRLHQTIIHPNRSWRQTNSWQCGGIYSSRRPRAATDPCIGI